MRVFGPFPEVGRGVRDIAKESPTKAYLHLARRDALNGGIMLATTPTWALLSVSEVAKDIYNSGELSKITTGRDLSVLQHPGDYVSNVFFHDPIAQAVAYAPLIFTAVAEGFALFRAGQAINSAVRRSRANHISSTH